MTVILPEWEPIRNYYKTVRYIRKFIIHSLSGKQVDRHEKTNE